MDIPLHKGPSLLLPEGTVIHAHEADFVPCIVAEVPCDRQGLLLFLYSPFNVIRTASVRPLAA